MLNWIIIMVKLTAIITDPIAVSWNDDNESAAELIQRLNREILASS